MEFVEGFRSRSANTRSFRMPLNRFESTARISVRTFLVSSLGPVAYRPDKELGEAELLGEVTIKLRPRA